MPDLVMVVEDEKEIRDLVRYNLEREGFAVAPTLRSRFASVTPPKHGPAMMRSIEPPKMFRAPEPRISMNPFPERSNYSAAANPSAPEPDAQKIRRKSAGLAIEWLIILLAAAVPHYARADSPTSAAPVDTVGVQEKAPGNAPASGVTPAAPAVDPAPPDYPRGKISGYLFGDAYYNTAGDPAHVYTATGGDLGQANIDGVKPITRDLNGIQVRRVYFQLDNDLSERYSTRLRLEMDGKTLTPEGKLGTFVKNAYFQARSVIPRGDFQFGLVSTPSWENSEEFWKYRSIEKTLADFRGIGASADLGVALKGFVDSDHHAGYSLVIGDGNGQKPETDRFKKVYLSLPFRFGELRLEPYVDAQAVRVNLEPKLAGNTDSLAVNNDQATYKLFAGYEFHRWGLGAEGVVRVQHAGPAATREPRGASLFARGTLTPTLGAFARVDVWQPDHRSANRLDSRLWMAGFDWQPFKDVHVMPNVEGIQYVVRGTAVAPAHPDVQARITFYCRFSRPQS